MAILYGTTADGTTLPVLVDQFGNLLAKGIDGEPGTPGTPGPPGPPGGAFPLPEGATDGALLGWQDGELVWITEPLPPVVAGFRPIIYTGNGASQSITGVGFSPDLVWIKCRSVVRDHMLFDTIRGATNYVKSNLNAAEQTNGTTLTSFDSDGFTLGGDNEINFSGNTYVAWCWDAGDTTVTNNDGTIESQVRSNGNFSVVSYSAADNASQVGHGLSSTPSFIITKPREAGVNWNVYHSSYGVNSFLKLNTTDSKVVDSGHWGSVDDTTFGTRQNGDNSLNNMIAYCWAETPGASRFGSYLSTGSRLFISVGFLPSLVIIKSTGTGNWFMFDSARGVQQTLRADLGDKEDQTGVVEFRDDGFQLLFSLPGVNQANVTYVYAAFANPSDAAIARKQMRRDAYREERQQNETQPRLKQ